MSNYNTQLQSNNTDLQSILNTINALPNPAEWFETEDALVARTLTEYSNDRVTSIGANAFYSYSSLTSVNFPACISIGETAFGDAADLISANFPACTSIGVCAF